MGYSARDMIGAHELKDPKLWRACVAEIFGTMILVFVGCGSVLATGGLDVVRISLCFGITVASLAQAIGHISGCHINPAVSVGLFAGGKMGVIKMGIYIGCQFGGAVLGAIFLLLVTPDYPPGTRSYFGSNIPSKSLVDYHAKYGYYSPGPFDPDTKKYPHVIFGELRALLVEFLLTMVLVLTVFGATDERNEVKGSAPLAIGLSITACHLYGVTISGSSINPARSFGPALIYTFLPKSDEIKIKDYDYEMTTKTVQPNKPLRFLWIYFIGPILGGAAAGVLYTFVFRTPGPDNRTAPAMAQMPMASSSANANQYGYKSQVVVEDPSSQRIPSNTEV